MKKINDGLTATQRYAKRHPEKRKAQYRAWYERNREHCKRYQRAYYAKHPEYNRHYNMKAWYGLDRETYEAMLRAQKNLCAICQVDFSKWKRKPGVDHCHVTGQVRGLLCAGCNARLHALENKPWRDAAEKYLSLKRTKTLVIPER